VNNVNNEQDIFEAVRYIWNREKSTDLSQCPPKGWETTFPDSASDMVVTHVAFCAKCQQTLQTFQLGHPFKDPDRMINIEALDKKIARVIRWNVIRK